MAIKRWEFIYINNESSSDRMENANEELIEIVAVDEEGKRHILYSKEEKDDGRAM